MAPWQRPAGEGQAELLPASGEDARAPGALAGRRRRHALVGARVRGVDDAAAAREQPDREVRVLVDDRGRDRLELLATDREHLARDGGGARQARLTLLEERLVPPVQALGIAERPVPRGDDLRAADGRDPRIGERPDERAQRIRGEEVVRIGQDDDLARHARQRSLDRGHLAPPRGVVAELDAAVRRSSRRARASGRPEPSVATRTWRRSGG